MISVLIAEDELLVRLGLKNMVDWESAGMSVVADVGNGAEAWEAYQRLHPDLMIVDLKMPVMGGMELIERIRSQDRDTGIVILSCLEEFELVRRAMALGVSDYIPKLSASREDIMATLTKTGRALLERKASRGIAGSAESERRQMREQRLRLLLDGSDEVRAADGLPEELVVCLLELDDRAALRQRNSRGDGFLQASLRNIADDVLARAGAGETVPLEGALALLLEPGQLAGHELEALCRRIIDAAGAFFNVTATVGASPPKNGPGRASEGMWEAAMALRGKLILGGGRLLFHDPETERKGLQEKLQRLQSLPELPELLGGPMLAAHGERVGELQRQVPDASQAQRFFQELVLWTAAASRHSPQEVLDAAAQANRRFLDLELLDSMIDEYHRFLAWLLDHTMGGRASKPVSDAIRHIRDHYAEALDLRRIAECAHVNPAYLSKLFKADMKTGIVEYINRVRIEKARELMEHTHLKSYEISEQVGFSEYTYFSKVFKKMTGQNPNEYRKGGNI